MASLNEICQNCKQTLGEHFGGSGGVYDCPDPSDPGARPKPIGKFGYFVVYSAKKWPKVKCIDASDSDDKLVPGQIYQVIGEGPTNSNCWLIDGVINPAIPSLGWNKVRFEIIQEETDLVPSSAPVQEISPIPKNVPQADSIDWDAYTGKVPTLPTKQVKRKRIDPYTGLILKD